MRYKFQKKRLNSALIDSRCPWVSYFFKIKCILFLVLCVGYKFVSVDAQESQKMGVKFTGTGVTGGCKQPDVGAGNWTLVLYKSSKHP